jgi:ParB-like nuclease domain
MSKIIETKDYNIFKISILNRPIEPSNLKKIIASLEANNLLEFDPIIVNSEMEVIDGQHRLAAAKHLGISVWYTINDKSQDEDIILLNAAKKSWHIEDYVNFYAKKGNEDYIKLLEFCKKHQLTASKCAKSFFTHMNGSPQVIDLKNGKFRFPSQEQIITIEETIASINIVKETIERYCFNRKSLVKSSYFLRALSMLFHAHEFDSAVFLRKVALKADSLHICGSAGSYYKMFLDIYNFRNSNPIKEIT